MTVAAFAAGIGFVAALAALSLVGHLWWHRRHSIDTWAAEPYERYRRLRGWT